MRNEDIHMRREPDTLSAHHIIGHLFSFALLQPAPAAVSQCGVFLFGSAANWVQEGAQFPILLPSAG